MRLKSMFAVFALSGVACSGADVAPKVDPWEAAAAEKCPLVHLDRMDTEWLHAAGGDGSRRFRVTKAGEGYTLDWTQDGASHTRLKCERRDIDARCVEVGTPAKQKAVKAGEDNFRLIFLQPSYKQCSMQVFSGLLGQAGKEDIPPTPDEYLPFPAAQSKSFAFGPATGTLFVADAAKDAKKAQAELDDAGANEQVSFGHAIPVAAWTDAAKDGDASCTYDMDLFLDGKGGERTAVPAGEVTDGKRHWYVEWDASFSGNHQFRIERFRTCAGGARELIGVNAIDAILMN